MATKHGRRRLSLLMLALLLVGCAAAPVSVYSFHAQRLNPEDWFRRLHEQMQNCLGVERDYDDIEWLVTPAGVMGPWGETLNGEVAGMWSWQNRIYLDARFSFNDWVVRHEIAHWLTQQGDALHADPLFLACTGI